MATFADLPDSVLLEIFSYLPVRDRIRISRCGRPLREGRARRGAHQEMHIWSSRSRGRSNGGFPLPPRVCHHWKKLVDDRWLWRHVDLTLYTVCGSGRAVLGRGRVGQTSRTTPPTLCFERGSPGCVPPASLTCSAVTSRPQLPHLQSGYNQGLAGKELIDEFSWRNFLQGQLSSRINLLSSQPNHFNFLPLGLCFSLFSR